MDLFFYKMTNILRVGTDCSGIETPILALQELNLPFQHVFSSEIDANCIKTIKANFSPEILYNDIVTRDVHSLPDIDLYICGFPCQPFSEIGNRTGFSHKSGHVFWSCLEVITTKQPKFFILENVKGLLYHNKINRKKGYGESWKLIWGELEKLKELGYNVKWSILNTKDYGIPQNRERVYIIGKKDGEFEWPTPIPSCPTREFVDWENVKKYETSERNKKYINSQSTDCIFLELQNCSFNNKQNPYWCPCVTANSRIWCIPLERYITCKEIMKLQGVSNLKQVVSDSEFKKQLGNGMSVNVLKCLLNKLLL